MKIVTMPEVNEQSIVVSSMLTIELRQVGNDYLEIRLISHYEDRIFYKVHNVDGFSENIHLSEANQVILNYILENKIDKR